MSIEINKRQHKMFHVEQFKSPKSIHGKNVPRGTIFSIKSKHDKMFHVEHLQKDIY